MNNFDAIVIGSGPAGISCAVYLKRYNHNVLVIGLKSKSLEKAHLIENYYGIESISGSDLYDNGIKQAKSLGISVKEEEVIDIEYISESNFNIKTNLDTYNTKTVVLALGVSRNSLAIANKFEGSGVSYCATCDGFFYRKKKVALIGNGSFMKHEYDVLKNMIPDLTIFTNGEELTVDIDSNNIIKDKIISFDGDLKLETIKTTDSSYQIDGAFIALGNQSGFTLAKHLGIALEGNYIKVNSEYQTNIKGIYAIGDCIGGLLQVSKAVSDGAVASSYISKYLKQK